MKNATVDNVHAAAKRPRSLLLLSVIAIMAVAIVVTCVISGRQTDQGSGLASSPQVTNVITPDPELPSTSAHAWLINPLRSACAGWDNETGSYRWLTGPLEERGITKADILAFCERFDEVFITSVS